MDFDSRIHNALRLDKTRLRQFLRNTVLFVISNDPNLDEEARTRVKSLQIPESESGDFLPQVGLYIIRQLRSTWGDPDYENEIRVIVRSLIIITSSMDEFFSYFSYYVSERCQEWFKAREPRHYLHFLATICEFCCKIAEVDEYEGYICLVLQRAEHYMNVFRGAFPGYEVLTDYAQTELQSMPEY